jgi:hypothetical protein
MTSHCIDITQESLIEFASVIVTQECAHFSAQIPVVDMLTRDLRENPSPRGTGILAEDSIWCHFQNGNIVG